MTMAAKRKKRNYKAYSQCDVCATACYSIALKVRTSRLEFEAIGNGVAYECDDFTECYWTKVCA